MSRYIVNNGEVYAENREVRGYFRYVYDTKYNTFVFVQRRDDTTKQWLRVNYVSEAFYKFHPAFSKAAKSQERMPPWESERSKKRWR